MFPHSDRRVRIGLLAVTAAAMLLLPVLAASAQAMRAAPGVTVSDQTYKDARVVVQRVTSDGPGWIMIHADNNGSPGAVIGYAAVRDGTTTDIVVAIDATRITPVLYAMLHKDAGVVGKLEFPGADTPVFVNGAMVSPGFKVKSEY